MLAEEFEAAATEAVSEPVHEKAATQTTEPEQQTEAASPTPQKEAAPQATEPEQQAEAVSPTPKVAEENPQAEKAEEDSMMYHVFRELRDIHRICQNFQAGRMRAAESELEKYHEIDRGRVFDDIFRDVARIYVDHESLPLSIEDEALRKRVNNILLDVLQLLEGYGVRPQKSEQGSERKLRLTHVVGYEETDDPELHGKIAASVQTGFYRENSAVMQELVKIYRKVK